MHVFFHNTYSMTTCSANRDQFAKKPLYRGRTNFVARNLLVAIVLIMPGPALAGPPFLTDDPEPVAYQHWEIDTFSQGVRARNNTSGVLPGADINYGALPDVQLHIIVPMAFNATSGQPFHYGYGDTELGVKYRFIHENKESWWPEVGVYPFLEAPTGDAHRNLGAGETREFLPVWAQKNFDNWQTYGGGGYWNNPGAGNRNYWFFGWVLQRKITEALTFGGELFHQTATTVDGSDSSGFNLGGTYDFSANYHLLFSAGRGIQNAAGTNQFSYYLAFGLTY
jgi:hypothetical protein